MLVNYSRIGSYFAHDPKLLLDKIKSQDLNLELIPLQEKIKKSTSFTYKPSATQKQLLKRQLEILNELQKIKDTYDSPKQDPTKMTLHFKKMDKRLETMQTAFGTLKTALETAQQLLNKELKKVSLWQELFSELLPQEETTDTSLLSKLGETSSLPSEVSVSSPSF